MGNIGSRTINAVRIISQVFILCFCALFLAGIKTVRAEDVKELSLLEMDLETLMSIPVTSVSKKQESLFDSAAAIYVITADDIRRSGATHIVHALRMVPGLIIAQNNSTQWSVSSRSRCFNPTYENKLLVMLDGQSVYTSVYGGTFWDTLSLFLPDIDRIEVIRGSGSSTWGSNAVNGVINIITKSAEKTAGMTAVGRIGGMEKGMGAVRYGKKFDSGSAVRVHGGMQRIYDGRYKDGSNFEIKTFGTRFDLPFGEKAKFVFSGELLDGISNGYIRYADTNIWQMNELWIEEKLSNIRLNSVYSYDFSDTSQFSLQFGYIREARKSELVGLCNNNGEVEIDFSFSPFEKHLVQIGGEMRVSRFEALNPFDQYVLVDDSVLNHTDYVGSGFVVDTISLTDRLTFALGGKFEYIDDIGFQYSPGVRFSFRLNEQNVLWTAMSRSIRSPSCIERFVSNNAFFDQGTGALMVLEHNKNLKAENIHSYELSWRFFPTSSLVFDMAFFYNHYKELIVPVREKIVVPRVFFKYKNQIDGDVFGGEFLTTWEAADWFKMRFWYSYGQENFVEKEEYAFRGKMIPEHQAFLQTLFVLPYNVKLDLSGRHIGRIVGLDIPAYAEMDARLSYVPFENFEISLIGKNLLHDKHREVENSLVYGSGKELERTIFVQLRADF